MWSAIVHWNGRGWSFLEDKRCKAICIRADSLSELALRGLLPELGCQKLFDVGEGILNAFGQNTQTARQRRNSEKGELRVQNQIWLTVRQQRPPAPNEGRNSKLDAIPAAI